MKTLSALLALLILLPGLSCAGQLTVAPIRLTLAPNQANATFTLTNNASSEGFYQLQLLAWDQVDGQQQLRQQQDLVVTPPVTMIPGNTDQVVRIIRQQPTVSDKEKSYRLIISEIPDTESDSGAQLKVLLRLSVPVFVGDDAQQPALSAHWAADGIRIDNHGTGHARLSDVQGQGLASAPPLELKPGLAGYALPDRSLLLSLPKGIDRSTLRQLHFNVNGQPANLTISGDPT
ncbi:type 1 pili usher pathway chaperone CsuC [Alcanivorax sp. MD8A]|uniref:fimbrial biogenesis chaperone n=1 Tax=Alcanivorax sp. MD8A TaxID=1177157 RepID=UPI000C9B66D7|nr:fimbria/pilus periplasmic chaperone [Alcanivorax sp. MD8A]PNE04238.1 type 1 pili usher pathway chaperone CsuC [Alcanivorax sp. MD8A]